MVAGAAVTVILFLFLVIARVSSSDMVVLYSDLIPEDSGEVVRFLHMHGHQYSKRGEDIYVQAEEARELRMRLASEGIPNSGSIVGYEVFNKTDSFGMSSFNQNVNLLRALEGELARTISSFEGIKGARVHLVIPKRELFSKDKHETTASVVLKLRSGKGLSKKEIGAMTHLVSSSVQGLSINNITIVSTDGKSFKLSSSEDNEFVSTMNEYKFAEEKHMRETVESLLERYVGLGNVRAEAYADINFDREVVDFERYDPEGRVLRSEHITEESNNSTNADGSVSVANNIPGGGGSGGSSSAKGNKVDELKNYEISKEMRRNVKAYGLIKRLSVAVMIDGTYTKDVDGGIPTYVPRSEEELSKLRALVSSAIGIDESRGDKLEIVNMAFSQPEIEEEGVLSMLAQNIYPLINTLITSVVMLLIAFFIIKPIINRTFDLFGKSGKNENTEDNIKDAEAGDDAAGAAIDIVINDDIAEEGGAAKEETPIDKLNAFVKERPEDAVSIVRKWIYSEQEGSNV